MSTEFSGADVEQLRALSSRLKAQSGKLREISSSSSAALLAAQWTGNDIDAIRDNWKQRSLPRLTGLADSLNQMGAELDRQAQQQEQASGATAGSAAASFASFSTAFAGIVGGIAGVLPSFGTDEGSSGAESSPASETPESGSTSSVGGTDSSAPRPSDSDYQAWRDEQKRYYEAGGFWVDRRGAAIDNCTSWAAFRRDQMGLEVGSPPGNGHEMAGLVGGTANGTPEPGSLVSYADGSYGHVMVVEEVISSNPKSFRISEMNVYGMPDGTTRDAVWTQNGDGSWSDNHNRHLQELTISTGKH